MFSNHFITNFPQNAPVKNLRIGQYFTKMDKNFVAYVFLGQLVDVTNSSYVRNTTRWKWKTIKVVGRYSHALRSLPVLRPIRGVRRKGEGGNTPWIMLPRKKIPSYAC